MSTIIWHTRPVFITSTFRDMHAERDHLHNIVFPALEERLCERYHHLEPIDLRWGVETVGVDEQHAKEMLVLKVCLNEIERSRPFLIAILGDRYGWIPPEERITQAAREAGYREDLAGHSVTALEIEYGVLNSVDQQKRSFFYFRNTLPFSEMDAETAAIYSDQYSQDPEGKKAHQRLVELKARIEREQPERVHHYQVEWDREKNCVTGLEAWGRQVLEDLWNELDAETAELARTAESSWEQQERWALETFIESRSRDFVGREDLLDDLITLATSEAVIGADWGACITGPAGGGKSSLIAQLSKKLQNDDTILLTHSAGISPRSIQIENLLRRWVDELTTAIGIKSPLSDQTTAEELEKTFHEILGRGAANKRVIILIDALNQFDNSPQAKHLTWLPKCLPTNSRLIATAIPCTASETLQGKQGVQSISLQPLEQTEADSIIKKFCDRYHRELNPKVQHILLDKQDSSNQPASGNPLWLTLALEELNLLDADDFVRAEKLYSGTGEEKLLKLLLDVAEQLPGDVDDLYGWLLSRSEEVHGKEWTRAFVNLIAVSRTGWREADLMVLMPIISNQPWNDLSFASLRRGLRAHIVQRGRHGQWDFSHAQMRITVMERNLSVLEEKHKLHSIISDHLLGLTNADPLRETETMVHLIGAEDKSNAAHYYGGRLTNGEVKGATNALVDYLLSGGQQENGPEIGWVFGLMNEFSVENQEVAFKLRNRYVFNLNDALQYKGKLRLRLAMLESVADAIQGELAKETILLNKRLLRLSFAAMSKIGDVTLLLGNVDKSRAAYKQCIESIEKLAALDPSNTQYLYDLSISFDNMGGIEGRQDPQKARQWYQKGLEISEKLVNLDPDNTEYLLLLSVSFYRMGNVDICQDPLTARMWYQNGLEICEKLAALEPDNILYLSYLSSHFGNMGGIEGRQDPQKARQWHKKSLEIREKLVALDPDNMEYMYDLSFSFNDMGDIDGRQDPQKAHQWYQKGLKIREKLVALDPSNIQYLNDLSLSFDKMVIFDGRQDPQKARLWCQKCLEIREILVALEPDNTEYQRDLSRSFDNMGDIDGRQDPQKARLWYKKGLKIREKLVALDPGNIQYLNDLSFSFNCMGDVDSRQDPQNARQWYQKGLKIREKLLALEPDNLKYMRDLSIAFCNMGEVDGRQYPQKAQQWYFKALKIREKLVALDPDNIEYMRDLSIAFCNMGEVDGRQYPQKAQQWYFKALKIREKLVALDPDNMEYLYDLSFSFNDMGDIDGRQDPQKAHQWYQKGLKIREKLVALNPDNINYLRALSSAFSNMGKVAGRQYPQKAQQWYFKALESREKLVALDPDNMEYLYEVSFSYYKMGDLVGLQDSQKARQWYQKTLEIFEKLLALEPTNIRYLCGLTGSFYKMGNIDGRQDPQKARQWYLKVLRILEKLVDLDSDNIHYWGGMAESFSKIAETYLQQNMAVEEREYSQKAAKIMYRAEKLNPENPDIQYGVACAHARLGETDKALAALARSVELGGADIEDIDEQNADLASLRELPEFEAILERMKQVRE